MPAPILFVENNTVLINGKQVRAERCEPTLPDGTVWSLEGRSVSQGKYEQALHAHDFRAVRPVDVPNGVSISIYEPKSDFNNISSANFLKTSDRSKWSISVSLYFADWHYPTNLYHFANAYSEKINAKNVSSIKSRVESDELSISVWLTHQLEPEDDLYESYRRICSLALSSYRECLAQNEVNNQVNETTSSERTMSERWAKRLAEHKELIGTASVILGLIYGVLKFFGA